MPDPTNFFLILSSQLDLRKGFLGGGGGRGWGEEFFNRCKIDDLKRHLVLIVGWPRRSCGHERRKPGGPPPLGAVPLWRARCPYPTIICLDPEADPSWESRGGRAAEERDDGDMSERILEGRGC